jgi:hypothetical protein
MPWLLFAHGSAPSVPCPALSSIPPRASPFSFQHEWIKKKEYEEKKNKKKKLILASSCKRSSHLGILASLLPSLPFSY